MWLTFWSARLKTAFDDCSSNLFGEALADFMPEALEEDLPEDGALIGACKNWATVKVQ